MAQFRTTADIMDLALSNVGEVTNGNSPYEADLLNKLNRAYHVLIAGGTISLGKDITFEIDEVWPWARAKRPMILELQPGYEDGTVTLTLGSESGTLSSPPSYSLAGWYLRVSGQEGTYRIASHTASASAFELDGAWPLASQSGAVFSVFKLDYDLIPSYLVIDETNNKIDFKTTSGGSVLTSTLTSGSYTPADLATHIGTQMSATAAGPAISCSYNSVTKLFTLSSDGAGSTTLLPLFATGTNQKQSAHKLLGFDDLDSAAALSHTSVYILGGISRLIEPFKLLRGNPSEVTGLDIESFGRNYGFDRAEEGLPSRFAIVRENDDGSIRVRFDKYVSAKARLEIDYVPVPRDLKDNAGSIPLVPRKHIDVLEDAATFYVMLLKQDDRAQVYGELVGGKLLSMVNQHRGSLQRTGDFFGRTIPRRDLLAPERKKFFGEPY